MDEGSNVNIVCVETIDGEEDEEDELPVEEKRTSLSNYAWSIDISDWKTVSSKPKPMLSSSHHALTKTNSERVSSLPIIKLSHPKQEQKVSRTATSAEELCQRKYLDIKRWCCISRPQYKRSCGPTSLVSCWNYLFSVLGQGSLPPLTQEQALEILGFHPPFSEIRFGPFTGNATLMRWFYNLCHHFDVFGKAYYFFKLHGKGKTFGVNPSKALSNLKEGLRDPSVAFIYHCENHYFCPIGYEEVPRAPENAYRVDLLEKDVKTWILIGEPSSQHASIHSFRWDDIVKDLNCQNPNYFNVRHRERGVKKRNTKKVGGNLHGILAFKKVEWESVPEDWALDSGSDSDLETEDEEDKENKTDNVPL